MILTFFFKKWYHFIPLRVTAVGKVFSKKVPKEDSHHSGVMYGLFHFQKPNEGGHPERRR